MLQLADSQGLPQACFLSSRGECQSSYMEIISRTVSMRYIQTCYVSYPLHPADTRRLPQGPSMRISHTVSESFFCALSIDSAAGMGYIQKHVAFPTRCIRLIREVCRKVLLCAFPTQQVKAFLCLINRQYCRHGIYPKTIARLPSGAAVRQRRREHCARRAEGC